MNALQTLALLLALTAGLESSPARAENYILCSRDAEIVPVNPESTTSDDPCSGKVLLQGISYECTQPEKVDRKREQFLKDLQKNGRKYCENYCRRRSTAEVKCRGLFTEPEKCGFTVPTREAARFGRDKAPCNPRCGGTAFAYCSIYHSSTLLVDASLFEGMSPNCRCERAN